MKPQVVFRSNTIGNIIAFGIPEELYLRDYAEYFCEWINGTVIQMSSVHKRHDKLTRYLATLLDAYFERHAIGQVRQAPFVMRLVLDEETISNREPDIQIILRDNVTHLTPTRMQSAADIVIEVVSQESVDRDYAEKFREYERGGVREYWIINPLKDEARFYRLAETGDYLLQAVETHYHTPLLPHFQLEIATLWQDTVPRAAAISQMIDTMFSD